MITHCTQTAQQMTGGWLSPLVGSLLVATVVMANLQLASPAAAAECFVTKDTVAVQHTPSWDAIISPVQVHPTIVTRDCACEPIPYLNGSTFVLGKGDNLETITLTTCFRPTTWKTALLDQAALGPIGKINSKMQPLRVFTLTYNNMRQVFKVRIPPPEIKRSTNYRPAVTIIGPVQELPNSPPSDERSMTQTIPLVPPIDKPSWLFGNHLWGPLNPFQWLQQAPNSESHRMNMTTTLALHGRDCVSDCP